MKKLKLELDDLRVDSFTVTELANTHRSTVKAHISLMSCSCVECVTDLDCGSGGCGTRYAGGTCEYATCAPTCAGWSCEFQTCNC